MFARAPKRRLPQDLYRQSIYCLESLQLPFLCPALFFSPKQPRRTASIVQTQPERNSGHSRVKAVKRTPPNGASRSRGLASAATAEHLPYEEHYVPWEESTFTRPRYRPMYPAQSIATLPEFDPASSPIIINDSLSTHPKKFRVSKDAVGGNVHEIHQTLHACLQVGRLERAATLVRRLNQLYKPDAPGLLAAHNDYLTELALRVVEHNDQQLLHHLQRWFQVDLRDVGVSPNATTYAMMVRASLQTLDVKKDRTVRRYINLAKEEGLGEETLTLLSQYEHEDSAVSLLFRQQPDTAVDEFIEPEPEPPGFSAPIPAKEIEEVREMEQKGFGLSTLKKSLSIFSKTGSTLDSGHEQMSPLDRQRRLEADTVNAAMDRWREEDAHLKSIGINSGLSTSPIGAMMWKWHEKLVPRIKDDLRQSQEAERKDKKSKLDEESLAWGPYLQSLPVGKVSAIAILSAMKTCSSDALDDKGARIFSVVTAIGNALQNESIAETTRQKKKTMTRRASTAAMSAQSKNESLAKRIRGSFIQDYDKMEWSAAMKVKLGALLLSHLMDIAKIDVSRKNPETGLPAQELQPVFFHTYQYIAGKRVGVVRLNSAMLEKLAKVPVCSALAKYLPMVCEPKPWTGYSEGGFLEYPVPVIRINSGDSQARRYAVTAARNGDLAQVFAGLDVLAKTPWQVNRFVFDTMLEAWNSGEAIADIPQENISSEMPPEPPPSINTIDRYRWMRRVREIENRRSSLKSQRCFQNFQLEVARAYLDETFYFPHNCDFRGRAYPMAPFLNHMGADNVRGLLTFAQGKELTADGLWWLKVHLANVYGYDKASFAERLAFTEEHLPEIRESVSKPFGENAWWLKAEDPWQCLAACKEVTNALNLPDPTKYVCKLAIHQDGTCNGLQHYAALGGDVAGAQQVNLEPGKRPSDIYTGVAEIVKAEIAKDAIKGSALAKALDGKVTRKVVKQTVMTNVYGVTFTGAKRQVRRQLDDLLSSFPDTNDVSIVLAAPYIARKIFAALTTIFNGAHDIQYWLTDCAARISESLAPEQVKFVERAAKGEISPSIFKRSHLKGTSKTEVTDFKTTVIWTTPLKMPVVQPYRKKSARRIDTNLQKITIMDRSAADPVDKAKQLQAFPPNFIHSLDATHMFLTALKCNEVGLTFAAIHDSFWTHAGDVHTMNRIIRDAFIRMHSEDIVGRLAAEFKARYKDFMQLASVRHDTPVGQKILAWRRARSKELGSRGYTKLNLKSLEALKWDELVLERRRLNLLSSEDPKEREQGELMNTPGKMFSEMADEKSLAPLDGQPATIGLSQSLRDSKLQANQQLDVGDVNNTEPIQPATNIEVAPVAEKHSEDPDPNLLESDDLGEVEPGCDEDEEIDTSSSAEVRSKTKTTKIRKTWLWIPLTFPPVPKKGDFDVTRLKDSQYFFS